MKIKYQRLKNPCYEILLQLGEISEYYTNRYVEKKDKFAFATEYQKNIQTCENSFIFVAMDAKTITGFILGNNDIIQRFYLDQKYTKMKIGHQLLKLAEQQIIKNNQSKAWVSADNEAIGFYEKNKYIMSACGLMSKELTTGIQRC